MLFGATSHGQRRTPVTENARFGQFREFSSFSSFKPDAPPDQERKVRAEKSDLVIPSLSSPKFSFFERSCRSGFRLKSLSRSRHEGRRGNEECPLFPQEFCQPIFIILTDCQGLATPVLRLLFMVFVFQTLTLFTSFFDKYVFR